jgi:acylphosphatase
MKQKTPRDNPSSNDTPPEKPSGGQRRLHAFFSGHVQGVGFRYTASSIAREFPIAGWVRNLDDGRVELVAEGELGDVETFLNQIRSEMGSYIRNIESAWEPATGEYSDFRIGF